MSRDYQEYCIVCKKFDARSSIVLEKDGKNYKLYQCMNLECGICFVKISYNQMLTTKRESSKVLRNKNYMEKVWEQAVDEIMEIVK